MSEQIERRISVAAGITSFRADLTTQSRNLEGYASIFNERSEKINDQWYERIAFGAFRAVLESPDLDVRFTINHDPNSVLGRTTAHTLTLKEDSKGLFFRVSLANTSAGRDLYEQVQRRDVTQCSFSFKGADSDWGYEGGAPCRTIRSIERLLDVSAVTFPAYPGTSVDARSRGFNVSHVVVPEPKVPPALANLSLPQLSRFLKDTFGEPADKVRDRRRNLLSQI